MTKPKTAPDETDDEFLRWLMDEESEFAPIMEKLRAEITEADTELLRILRENNEELENLN